MDEMMQIRIGAASVFLAFKAEDYIPGPGRVTMNQLVLAFERTTGSVLTEPQLSIFVDQIIEIEMEIMCLSGFNFCPC